MIGDSILRNVDHIKDTVVDCHPGATIARLTERMMDPRYQLHKYDIVVVHVGTNNIWSDSKIEIQRQFCELVERFLQVHPRGHVGFSCLLPRHRDEKHTRSKVMMVNEALMNWCAENGCICLRTFSPFTKNGRARRELFKQDGLHPRAVGRHPTGVEVLTNFFSQQLCTATLRPRVRALELAYRE